MDSPKGRPNKVSPSERSQTTARNCSAKQKDGRWTVKDTKERREKVAGICNVCGNRHYPYCRRDKTPQGKTVEVLVDQIVQMQEHPNKGKDVAEPKVHSIDVSDDGDPSESSSSEEEPEPELPFEVIGPVQNFFVRLPECDVRITEGVFNQGYWYALLIHSCSFIMWLSLVYAFGIFPPRSIRTENGIDHWTLFFQALLVAPGGYFAVMIVQFLYGTFFGDGWIDYVTRAKIYKEIQAKMDKHVELIQPLIPQKFEDSDDLLLQQFKSGEIYYTRRVIHFAFTGSYQRDITEDRRADIMAMTKMTHNSLLVHKYDVTINGVHDDGIKRMRKEEITVSPELLSQYLANLNCYNEAPEVQIDRMVRMSRQFHNCNHDRSMTLYGDWVVADTVYLATHLIMARHKKIAPHFVERPTLRA